MQNLRDVFSIFIYNHAAIHPVYEMYIQYLCKILGGCFQYICF